MARRVPRPRHTPPVEHPTRQLESIPANTPANTSIETTSRITCVGRPEDTPENPCGNVPVNLLEILSASPPEDMTGQQLKNSSENMQKKLSQNTQSKQLENSCANMHVNRHVNVNASPSASVLALMQVPLPETRSTTPAITASLKMLATFAVEVERNPDGLHTINVVMKKKLPSLQPSTEE